MALEIERKYLVKDNGFESMATSHRHIMQGYLSVNPHTTIRVRIIEDAICAHGFITVKSKTRSFTRNEWEYEIPADDAREMMSLAQGTIDKTRWIVPYQGHTWEIDVFHGRHAGLVMAEIELDSEAATFALPPFVGDEVTGIPRYYNSYLAQI